MVAYRKEWNNGLVKSYEEILLLCNTSHVVCSLLLYRARNPVFHYTDDCGAAGGSLGGENFIAIALRHQVYPAGSR